MLNDKMIIQLYLDRNERAITETDEKYGPYCRSIANNILNNREDVHECINDTYFKTWNSIPPNIPKKLSAYLAKIVRNLAFNRYRMSHTSRRGGGQTELVLEELGEIISDVNTENEFNRREFADVINSFVLSLPEKQRNIFLCRYWYADSISQISSYFKITENNVSVTLNRLRNKFRKYLEERGIEL